MEYLNAYLICLLTSLGISTVNELRMYKDAADKGYRLNTENINKSEFRKKYDIPKNMSLLLFVPIVNIINTIVNVLKYETNHEIIFNKLNKLGNTERMTMEEQEIYEEFPIGLTSRLLNAREQDELADCASVKVTKNSRIYYALDDEGQFEIHKVSGPLSKKTPSEQIEALRKYREELLRKNNIELNNHPRIKIRKK